MAITGVGFQPDFVMVLSSRASSTGAIIAGCIVGVGFSKGSGTAASDQHSRYWTSNRSAFGAEPTLSSGAKRNGEVISDITANTNGTVTAQHLAGVISLDADGFTLDPSLAGDTNTYVYLAIGGGIDVALLTPNWATATGAQSVTGAGFTPTLALFLATLSSETFSLGWYDGTRQGCLVTQTQNNTTGASVAKSYQVTDQVIALLDNNTGALAGEAEATGFTADGIDIDWSSVYGGSAESMSVILLGGVRAQCGALTQPASTGEQTISGLGLSPSAVMFLSACRAASASVQANARVAIGLSDGTTNVGTWNGDEDAVTTYAGRRNVRTMRTDAAIVMGTPTGTSTATINAQAEVTSLSSAGAFTLDWGAADGTAREVLYLALGAGPPAVVGAFVAGQLTRVTASRAVAFGLDGDQNTHDEEGVLKTFGQIKATEDITSQRDGDLVAEAYAKGTGAVPGKAIVAGRNTSGDGAAGVVSLSERDGTARYLWFEAGAARVHTAPPTEDDSVDHATAGSALGGSGGGTRSFGWTFDGAGAVLTTGAKSGAAWRAPVSGTITKWTLLADQAGAIVIDIWNDTLANYPPDNTDSITASAPPTIASANDAAEDSTLTGWITAFSAGDIFIPNIDSVTDIERCTLLVEYI